MCGRLIAFKGGQKSVSDSSTIDGTSLTVSGRQGYVGCGDLDVLGQSEDDTELLTSVD